MIEFFLMLGAIVIFLVIAGWRKGWVISSVDDSVLIEELKRRAYERKMKDQTDTEVNAMVKSLNQRS